MWTLEDNLSNQHEDVAPFLKHEDVDPFSLFGFLSIPFAMLH